MGMTRRSEWCEGHISDLIAQGLVRYKAFELLDKRDLGPDASRTVRRALIDVAEAMLHGQLRDDGAMLECAQGLFDLNSKDAGQIFKGWAETLNACDTAHKAAKFVCYQCSSLVRTVPGSLQPRFLDLAPQLVARYGNGGLDVMSTLAGALAEIGSSEGGTACLDVIERYLPKPAARAAPTAPPEAVNAIARLSVAYHRKGQMGDLARFADLCSPEQVKHDPHCESFTTAFAAGLEAIPSSLVPKYMALCMTAGRSSFGSAGYVASRLPKWVGTLKADTQGPFVDSFLKIVTSAGIGAVAFCSKQLLHVFKTKGNAAGLGLTSVLCEIADGYGPSAARAFIEKKTPTSRRYSPAESA